jgi:PST family polysaccharide transporter
MPSFSRIAHQPERYRIGFREMLEKIAMLLMPCAALVAVCANSVVQLLFGSHWLAATPLVACFASAVAYQPLIQISGLLYLTQNRPREMVRAALIDSALCILAVVTALPFGAVWVAASIASVGLIIRLPIAFWLAGLRGPVRFFDLSGSVLPSAFAAICVALVVYTVRHLLLDALTLLPNLLLSSIAGLAACMLAFLGLPRSRRALVKFGELARVIRERGPDNHSTVLPGGVGEPAS